MCLILFSFQPDSPQPLVVAANRDEFYARPASAAHYWEDNPNIFAGRDLTARGTWLGVSRTGRFAALTNFSAGDPVQDYPASRGELVADFLASDMPAREYLKSLKKAHYAGFNLLVFDGQNLHYTTNKDYPDQQLGAGTYGLSNAELAASWPKSVDGAEALKTELANMGTSQPSIPALLNVLGNAEPPPDNRLPVRPHMSDMPLETRRTFAARFIAGDDYGTRAMTLVTFKDRHIDVFEQQIGSGGVRGTAVFARVPQH